MRGIQSIRSERSDRFSRRHQGSALDGPGKRFPGDPLSGPHQSREKSARGFTVTIKRYPGKAVGRSESVEYNRSLRNSRHSRRPASCSLAIAINVVAAVDRLRDLRNTRPISRGFMPRIGTAARFPSSSSRTTETPGTMAMPNPISTNRLMTSTLPRFIVTCISCPACSKASSMTDRVMLPCSSARIG